ncbi:MAG: hypothetical protein RL341_386 [Pseudomonadota bacterium]
MRTHRILMALAVAVSLLACSPAFDWREMPISDGRARVLFPAKPVTATREMALGGKGYSMTLTAARIGGAQFAAGSIPVGSLDASSAAQAWAAAMLANVQASTAPQNISLKNASGALEAVADGQIDGAPARLHARFAWREDRVFAAIALGRVDELSAEHAKTFATSLALP